MKQHICVLLSLLMYLCCNSQPIEVEKRIENGVEVIVNHLKPYKIEGESSNLSLEKELSIDTEKDEVAELGIPDIQGFDVDSDGNIYIFIPSRVRDNLIYKFDGDGTFLTSFAPRGQGPGEIQHAAYLRITENEEIPVVDTNGLKLVYFNKDGDFLRETKLPFKLTVNGYVCPLENGNYLADHIEGELRQIGEGLPKEGVQRALSLFDSDFSWIKYISLMHYSSQLLDMRSPHMLPVRSWKVSDGRIFFGTSRRGYEICVFDLNGNIIRKIKKEYKPVRFPKDLREEWEGRNRAVPDVQPPFQRLFFTDDEGRLFIMTFEKGLNPNEYIFDIFNSDGVFVESVSLDAFVRRSANVLPLYATAKNKRLFCLREKENGYKELVVNKMIWE